MIDAVLYCCPSSIGGLIIISTTTETQNQCRQQPMPPKKSAEWTGSSQLELMAPKRVSENRGNGNRHDSGSPEYKLGNGTMKALAWFGPGDVRLVDALIPDTTQDDDVILRVTGTTICGSDLHFSAPFCNGAHTFAHVHGLIGTTARFPPCRREISWVMRSTIRHLR